MPTAKAKLFWSGQSQEVRLPKEFWMAGAEVRIRRQGAAVVLEPLPADLASDWVWLDAIAGKFSGDFFPDGREPQPEYPPHPELDKAFK